MVKLAGARLVAEAKIAGYLLNKTHPQGAAKARFFAAFGFEQDSPSPLTQAILDHPAENEVARIEETAFGRKTIVECRLSSPDGRDPCVRTIWILEPGDALHRFVTAYPAPGN